MNLISNLDVRNEFKKQLLDAVWEQWENRASKEAMRLEIKGDGSPVTALDTLICSLLKSKIRQIHHNNPTSYYSEEEQGVFTFPVYIVDPIDGTKEFVEGRPEFAISVGLMNSKALNDPANEAWILNPLTGFEMESSHLRPLSNASDLKLGLVSRSEWNRGLFKADSLTLSPIGSIAYKLALLAAGACDFVVSKRPKNVWDIAAGSILLAKRGLAFYEKGQRIHQLEARKYEPPLVWCHPDHFAELKAKFQF